MKAPQSRLLTQVLLVVAVATVAVADTTSDPARSVDNIPPAPASEIRALNTGDDILITWNASVDDAQTFTPFGDTFVPTGGLFGYRVYRKQDGADEVLIGTAPPAAVEFTDPAAEPGQTYIYTVRAFDADNETEPDIVPGSADDLARIVALGGGPPDVVVTKRVKAVTTLDVVVDLEDDEAVETFRVDFIAQLAASLGIDLSRIVITAIRLGSTIVEFEILDVEDGADEPAAEEALATLITLVEEDAEAVFGVPVLEVVDDSVDEVVVVPQPIDPDGVPVLGWFSREGTQVGLDDFFLFADEFGLKDGDEGYEGRFDIVPNRRVDFDDFFRFADDFGKTVSNAAEIQALIGT